MLKILSFVALIFLSCGTWADSNKPPLEALVDTLNRIETISGTFVQYSVDQRGARVQESRGELKAERGGKFYWHTFEPLEQVVVSDGKQVTIYDPDLEQATIQKAGSALSNTPAILFSGDTQKIGELFNVELNSFDHGIRQFYLKPKGDDTLFDRLKLQFRGKNVSELRITDALGQESTMSFVQTQVNSKLSEDTFVLVLPEGTDVIRDMPTSQQ